MGIMGAWRTSQAVSSVVLEEREDTAYKEHQGKLMKGKTSKEGSSRWVP